MDEWRNERMNGKWMNDVKSQARDYSADVSTYKHTA